MGPSGALSATFWIVLVATLVTSVYGLAAFWAAWPRASWLWRWGPLTLLLAALAPLGAYELVAFNGAQAAAIVVGMGLARIVQARRAARPAQPTADASVDNGQSPEPGPYWCRVGWPRFGLLDVFKAVALMAGVMWLLRFAAPSSAAAFGTPIRWWPWIATGTA